MKYPSLDYDQLVQKFMQEGAASFSEARRRASQTKEKEDMHKTTQMTEAETQAEIARIQDGAVSGFEVELESPIVATLDAPPRKRRGRPPGSRNRPKETK